MSNENDAEAKLAGLANLIKNKPLFQVHNGYSPPPKLQTAPPIDAKQSEKSAVNETSPLKDNIGSKKQQSKYESISASFDNSFFRDDEQDSSFQKLKSRGKNLSIFNFPSHMIE